MRQAKSRCGVYIVICKIFIFQYIEETRHISPNQPTERLQQTEKIIMEKRTKKMNVSDRNVTMYSGIAIKRSVFQQRLEKKDHH